MHAYLVVLFEWSKGWLDMYPFFCFYTSDSKQKSSSVNGPLFMFLCISVPCMHTVFTSVSIVLCTILSTILRSLTPNILLLLICLNVVANTICVCIIKCYSLLVNLVKAADNTQSGDNSLPTDTLQLAMAYCQQCGVHPEYSNESCIPL